MKKLPAIHFLTLFLVAAGLAQPAFPQSDGPYKISGEMVASGDVGFYQVSPDGLFVVYLADQLENGVRELFSVPIGGGTAIRLNPNLVSGGGIPSANFLISADSANVVYVADQINNDEFELFSVPIAGGAAIRLNPDLVAGGDVLNGNFKVSADSTRVVYLADQLTNDAFELFSVPIAGGPSLRLNSDLTPGSDEVDNFEISADSTRVIYIAEQNTVNVAELFSVPIAGGPVTRLNPDLVTGGNVYDSFKISADSTRVIYTAEQVDVDKDELFSVPVAGGPAIRLNSSLVGAGDVQRDDFIISDDSARVIYIADQETLGVDELFSVPIAGGPTARLNPDLVSGGNVWNFLISPDSAHVIYLATQNMATQFELFTVPIADGPVIRLNSNFAIGDDVRGGYKISADSTRVVFQMALSNNSQYEIFSAPVIGGSTTLITPQGLSDGVRFGPLQISADSSRVLTISDQFTAGTAELFSVPIAGGETTRLNNDLPVSGNVNAFTISPDGMIVVYSADQDIVDTNELYARPLIDAQVEDGLCIPLSTSNGKVAVICL